MSGNLAKEARGLVPQRLRLAAKAAHLYFIDELSQQQIADSLHVSRSTVSRLVAEAREQGLVTISIHYPENNALDLERELEHAFRLDEAIVSKTDGQLPSSTAEQVAREAAYYLSRVIRPDHTIGVSGGSTVARVVRHLPSYGDLRARAVVQLYGTPDVGVQPPYDQAELVYRAAYLLRARYLRMPVPEVLEAKHAALLRSDPHIQEFLDVSRNCDVVIAGIGPMDPTSALVRSGRMMVEDVGSVRAMGGVGDICGRVFDIDGEPCLTPLDDQMIGLELLELKRIPVMIAVAYGTQKAEAILGALRGHLLSVLVTDADTATEVLRLAASASSGSGVFARARAVSR